MSKVIVKVGDGLGDTEVYDVPGLVTAAEKAAASGGAAELYSDSTETAEMVAEGSNVTDTDDWDEVSDTAFTSDEFFLASGFTVEFGTAAWSAAGAQSMVKRIARYRYRNLMRKALADADLPNAAIIAQASLSAGSRSTAVQTVLDALNTHLTNSDTAEASADAATTAAQLKAIFDALPADPYADEDF